MRRRERILEAATSLFIAYGYRKTTIDDVASAVGIAKGTVYLSYRTKAELLLHAVALQKRHYLAEMAPIVDPDLSAVDRLRALIELSVRMTHEMPLLARFSSGDHELEQVLRDADPSMLEPINRGRMDFAAQLLDEATGGRWPRERLESRARLLMDLVFAYVNVGSPFHQEEPGADQASELADVLLGGLLAEG